MSTLNEYRATFKRLSDDILLELASHGPSSHDESGWHALTEEMSFRGLAVASPAPPETTPPLRHPRRRSGPPQTVDSAQARHDSRVWLALIFVPGLYVCLLLGILSAVAGAVALAMVVAWVGQQFGVTPTGIILLLMIGALISVFALLRGAFHSIRRAHLFAFALPLGAQDAPGLFRLLEDLGQDLGLEPPRHIVLELGTGFYVTEARVTTLVGSGPRRTLCVSAPLIRFLSVQELRAVLGHELAHFTGSDTAFSRHFYPVYRGTQVALMGLSALADRQSEETDWVKLPSLLPRMFVAGYLALFATLERSVGRVRELRADQIGAQVSSPKTMASALLKLHALSPLWSHAVSEFAKLRSEGVSSVNLSTVFANSVREAVQIFTGVLEGDDVAVTHPTDTHPSMVDRLDALGIRFFRPNLTVRDPASALIPALEGLEVRLSQLLIAATGESPLQDGAPT